MPDHIRLLQIQTIIPDVTDLRNHNIEHGTKELCEGMPSLCLRPAAENGDLSFVSSARIAVDVPDWTYLIHKQWISKEPIQSPP